MPTPPYTSVVQTPYALAAGTMIGYLTPALAGGSWSVVAGQDGNGMIQIYPNGAIKLSQAVTGNLVLPGLAAAYVTGDGGVQYESRVLFTISIATAALTASTDSSSVKSLAAPTAPTTSSTSTSTVIQLDFTDPANSGFIAVL